MMLLLPYLFLEAFQLLNYIERLIDHHDFFNVNGLVRARWGHLRCNNVLLIIFKVYQGLPLLFLEVTSFLLKLFRNEAKRGPGRCFSELIILVLILKEVLIVYLLLEEGVVL
jgi:hypothetical protein